MTVITTNEAAEIELATRKQSDSDLWRAERQQRITSSNFGLICTAGVKRDFNLIARGLVCPKEFTSKAVEHGKKYESVAAEVFTRDYGSLYGIPTVCGLFISCERPWLAASPDRVINDSAVVEIKCPFAAKDCIINSVSVPYLKPGVNGQLVLDSTHPYYYQVQGQLYCTNLPVCYFCVFTITDFKVIKIDRNDAFIQAMLVKLDEFFDKFFKPCLLEKLMHREYCKHFG